MFRKADKPSTIALFKRLNLDVSSLSLMTTILFNLWSVKNCNDTEESLVNHENAVILLNKSEAIPNKRTHNPLTTELFYESSELNSICRFNPISEGCCHDLFCSPKDLGPVVWG